MICIPNCIRKQDTPRSGTGGGRSHRATTPQNPQELIKNYRCLTSERSNNVRTKKFSAQEACVKMLQGTDASTVPWRPDKANKAVSVSNRAGRNIRLASLAGAKTGALQTTQQGDRHKHQHWEQRRRGLKWHPLFPTSRKLLRPLSGIVPGNWPTT